MKKRYNLFYVPEKPDFELFSKELTPDIVTDGILEFNTEVTEDELELHIVLKKDGEDQVFAFGFPQIAAFNPELSEDLYKILDLKQVVLVIEEGARYTFELDEKNIADIKGFMGLA
ncbi:MAG: hypothetical protein PHH19_04185 [Eubacteriales bacterium]|nr:hypothetical protein [Eubacteriales bacterium]NCC81583.1 hypothetical protein [Clostridia bacterium]